MKIFAGKAASAYYMAKHIIHLINDVAKVVNHDPDIGDKSISTFAPSSVPIVSAPFRANFILLVPHASVPAAEICSERSAAGIISCARLTL